MEKATTERLALNVREVAERLGCSTRHVERMDSAGKLPAAVRLGGRAKRWRSAEISAWLNAGCPDRRTWNAMNERGKGR